MKISITKLPNRHQSQVLIQCSLRVMQRIISLLEHREWSPVTGEVPNPNTGSTFTAVFLFDYGATLTWNFKSTWGLYSPAPGDLEIAPAVERLKAGYNLYLAERALKRAEFLAQVPPRFKKKCVGMLTVYDSGEHSNKS